MKTVRALSFIVLLFVTCTSRVSAQWIIDAAAGYEFDDNISRAQLDSDIKSDHAFVANLSGGRFFPLTDSTGLALTADLGGDAFVRFDGLSDIHYGTSASLRHKFGLGPYAPWVRLAGSAAYHDFQHDPRDGWRYHFTVGLGKRFTDRLQIQVNYRYEQRTSDNAIDIPELVTIGIGGDAFDLEAHSVSLTGIYSITDNLSINLGYTRREGDVTSTTRRNLQIFQASDAITPDSAFGSDTFAYRIGASTNNYTIGLSWALKGHASINLGYEHRDTDANGGLEYANNIGRLNFLYSY